MKADIFIPSSKNSKHLKNCLDSIAAQTNHDFRVIVVAIHDDKKLRLLLDTYSFEYLLLVQSTPGLLNAANEALSHAVHDIFIRIDDDIVAEPKWLDTVLKTFESTIVGGVTGPTIIQDSIQKERDVFAFLNRFQNSSNFLMSAISHIYSDYIYEGKMREVSLFTRSGAFTLGSNFESSIAQVKSKIVVENLEACNFAVRRSLLKSLGGFDPIFCKGLSEYHEADVACKIRKAGYVNIFNPKAIVHHNIQRDLCIRQESFNRIQNFIIFYRRHIAHPNVYSWALFFLHVGMQNCYYFYLFLKTRNISLLGAVPGSLLGFFRKI